MHRKGNDSAMVAVKKYPNRITIMQRIPAKLLARVDAIARARGVSRNVVLNEATSEFVRLERIRLLSDDALFKD